MFSFVLVASSIADLKYSSMFTILFWIECSVSCSSSISDMIYRDSCYAFFQDRVPDRTALLFSVVLYRMQFFASIWLVLKQVAHSCDRKTFLNTDRHK